MTDGAAVADGRTDTDGETAPGPLAPGLGLNGLPVHPATSTSITTIANLAALPKIAPLLTTLVLTEATAQEFEPIELKR
jgi:hypothetical protein